MIHYTVHMRVQGRPVTHVYTVHYNPSVHILIISIMSYYFIKNMIHYCWTIINNNKLLLLINNNNNNNWKNNK